MVDIFISYASEDRSRVEALAKVLEDQGWTLWWDRSLPVAKPWHKLIEEAVDNARAILVVWSSTSVESDWVLAEAEDGLKRRILVPVLFEAVRIPLLFRSIQAANLIKWEEDQSDTNFKQLKQALISILGSPKQKKSKDLSEPSEQEPSEPAKTFKNTIGMKFVLIPADTFIMGSQKGEKDFDMFEKQHKVTLTKQYYLQNTTVTQKQWKRIIGTDPSRFIECGDECPVEKVSWNDTQQFISKLNNIENTNNYRLPTEAVDGHDKVSQ